MGCLIYHKMFHNDTICLTTIHKKATNGDKPQRVLECLSTFPYSEYKG